MKYLWTGLKVIYVIIVAACLFLLYFCFASYITTIVVYSLIAILAAWLLRLLFRKGLLKKPLYYNIRLMVFSILIALFIGETFLRFFSGTHKSYSELNRNLFYVSGYHRDRLRCFVLKTFYDQDDCRFEANLPNSTHILAQPDFTYRHTYNELGLRDDKLSSKNFKGAGLTILGLGDSFTEGIGTHQDSTWIKQLSYELEQRINLNVVSINGGTKGSDPIDRYILFNERLLQYKPDIVFVAVNNTDIDDLIYKGGINRIKGEGINKNQGPWWEYIYSFSFIFRHFIHLTADLGPNLMTAEQVVQRRAEALNDLHRVMLKFKQVTEAHSMELTVVIHPFPSEFQERNDALSQLAEEIQTEGIQVVDLLEEFRKHGVDTSNMYKFYHRLDNHHNTRGYGLWAEILADDVIRKYKLK